MNYFVSLQAENESVVSENIAHRNLAVLLFNVSTV